MYIKNARYKIKYVNLIILFHTKETNIFPSFSYTFQIIQLRNTPTQINYLNPLGGFLTD